MVPDEQQERIRARAYLIWIDEGRPEGRADAHWDMATELVAIEDNQLSTLKPIQSDPVAQSPTSEPVEPLLAVRNAGEFPTLTDQGEEEAYPLQGVPNIDEGTGAPASPERNGGIPRTPRRKR